MTTLKKDDVLTLEITDLNNLGFGAGKCGDGRVIFVRGAVTGDLVRARIIKLTRTFGVAKPEEILRPSPLRCREEFCPVPRSCGGCTYREIEYSHELSLKENYVRCAFAKAGLPDVTIAPILNTGATGGYRNKGQYPVCRVQDKLRAGFYASKTHRVVPAEDCRLQNPAFAPIVKWICREADALGVAPYCEETGAGLLRHIYLRCGEATGEIMVCLVLNGDRFPDGEHFAARLAEAFPAVVSVLLNENRKNTNVILGERYTTLFGRNYIEDVLCGVRFRITADSFYQVNRNGAELLYAKAAELAELSGGELVADLYCGTGTIGLTMAEKAGRLVGVEIVPAAVECANINARQNGIDNAEFFCADASAGETLLRCTGGDRPDVVILDPPRKGSTPALLDTLASLRIPRIVYVSCDPDTLARDVAYMTAKGYRHGTLYPVDMFPRCGHVETVVCLTRTPDDVSVQAT